MKKFVSILLAAMLLFALAATAMAAETVTITVANPVTNQVDTANTTNETYTAYKLLDATKTAELAAQALSLAGGEEGITYFTSDAAMATALAETTYFVFADGKVAGNNVKYVKSSTLTQDNQTAAAALLAVAKAKNVTGVALVPGEAKTLDIGFYVIESSLGTQVILVTTNMTIGQKNQYPTFTKAFDETPSGDTADANAKIDDTVEYVITVNVPATVNQNVVIHDTLGSGLTYVSTTATPNVTASADGQNITFTIAKEAANSTVTIKYTAKLNSTARSGNEYKNTAYLTYSNYQSVKIETVTKTNKITVNKYEGDEDIFLPGAVLQLQDADGNPIKLMADNANYRLATAEEAAGTSAVDRFTTTNAAIVIEGIDSDLAYKVAELEAPTGFNAAVDPATIAANPGSDGIATIRNYTGTTLPSTGSIGTTIFYVVGGLLIVAAGILLITKKRMSREG